VPLFDMLLEGTPPPEVRKPSASTPRHSHTESRTSSPGCASSPRELTVICTLGKVDSRPVVRDTSGNALSRTCAQPLSPRATDDVGRR